MNKFNNFIDGLAEYNLNLNEKQLGQFERYYELLIEKNRVMNLTTITDWEEVVEKHFLDSLAVVSVTGSLFHGLRLLDLGSGAGFPGIPLKLAFPELEVVLVDSLNKRVKFLQSVIEELGLKNISAIHSRAENLSRVSEHREGYGLVVSRAVAHLSVLAEYCLPFVKVGGQFISYKSGEYDEEVTAAKPAIDLLGGKLREVRRFQLLDASRAFVVIDKVKPTPGKYPRREGIPAKQPLS